MSDRRSIARRARGVAGMLVLAVMTPSLGWSSHAWVEGMVHNDIHTWTNTRNAWVRNVDQADNEFGRVADSMSDADREWGRLSGKIDLATGSVSLYADSDDSRTVRALAKIRDRFHFDDATRGQAAPVRQVVLEISVVGTLTRDAALTIWVNGVQRWAVSGKDAWSGRRTVRLHVRNGQNTDLNLRIEASAWNGGLADFRDGLLVRFSSEAPDTPLLIASDAGYDSSRSGEMMLALPN